MKKCPRCNDFALYDDNVQFCPVCETELIMYRRGNASGATYKDDAGSNTHNDEQPIRPHNRTQPDRVNTDQSTEPQFETRSGLRYQYRGTITEIHPDSRFNSRLKKWIYALLRSEPYQFGHTSHKTIIRVEGFHTGRVSGERRDLIFYGDVEGRFNHGDDVTITAKKRGDRYIVTNMYLNETQSYVRPGPQIPAGVIALATVGMFLLALFLIIGLINFIKSGAFWALLKKVVVIAIVIVAAWWLIRSLFRRR